MTKNIGFIGGGQMAEALLRGFLESGSIQAQALIVAEPQGDRRKYLEDTYQLKTVPSAGAIVKKCRVLILAIKPQIMPTVLEDIKNIISADQLIITIVAGLPLAFYNKHLQRTDLSIVRVMPNAPALILESASALCRNDKVSETDLNYAESLFKAIGTTVIVNEQAMDAVTGLSGSGPAYVLSFVEALIDGGVNVGLSRDIARKLAIQTIIGTTRLLNETTEHPAVLRDRVTSPGGTTIRGIHVLEKEGFSGTIISAVEAACKRSFELGKK